MITHYTLLSHMTQFPYHAIMGGLRLSETRAKILAARWNTDNNVRKDMTYYTVIPATDYCA